MLDASGFELVGTALIEQVPVEVAWRENFKRSNDHEPRRLVSLASRLDDQARAVYELDRPWITGPVDVAVDLEDRGDGKVLAAVDVVAADADISAPASWKSFRYF